MCLVNAQGTFNTNPIYCKKVCRKEAGKRLARDELRGRKRCQVDFCVCLVSALCHVSTSLMYCCVLSEGRTNTVGARPRRCRVYTAIVGAARIYTEIRVRFQIAAKHKQND
jgi:hypothetical protein